MTSPPSAPPLDKDPDLPAPELCPEHSGRLWTRQFVLVLLIQVSFGFSFSSFFLLPKYLEQELAATPSAMGQVVGMGPLSAVLGVPLIGWAIDRANRRLLLVLGSLLGAMAAFAHVCIDEIGLLLYALRACQGLAFLLTFNTAATLAAELAPRERLSQALGYFGVAMLSTNALAPALVEPLTDTMGWEYGFCLAGGAATLACCLALLTKNSTIASSDSSNRVTSLLDRSILAICYASMLVGLGFGTLVTFSQPFALSLGDREVRGLFIGYTLTAVTVRIVLGGLADRVGRLRVAFSALVLYALVILATSRLQSGWLFEIGMALGIAHGLLYPALNALIVENAAPAIRGAVMTVYNGAFNIGFAASVMLFGTIAELWGFRLVFLLAGSLTATGLISLLLLPKPASAA